jgi:LPXTG-motif cell wall-anchored protein
VAKTGVFPKWLVVAGFVVAALGFFASRRRRYWIKASSYSG